MRRISPERVLFLLTVALTLMMICAGIASASCARVERIEGVKPGYVVMNDEVTGKDKTLTDFCGDSATIDQYECGDKEPIYRFVRCKAGDYCMDGVCYPTSGCSDTDEDDDPFSPGEAQLRGMDLKDACDANGRLLTQYHCELDPKDDSIPVLVKSTTDCYPLNAICKGENGGKCVRCPDGTSVGKGRCIIADRDVDSIPDVDDRCASTEVGDAVDLRRKSEMIGCSCAQNAEVVSLINDKGELYSMPCSILLAGGLTYPFAETCKDGLAEYPAHCCDNVDNLGELLVDCGGECKPCQTQCTKIVEGSGSYDVVLVPMGYSASKDPELPGNYDDWVLRAAREAVYLSTTPPFCKSSALSDPVASAMCDGTAITDKMDSRYGHVEASADSAGFQPLVNVWRLDVFVFNYDINYNTKLLPDLYFALGINKDIRQLCPDTDVVIYTDTAQSGKNADSLSYADDEHGLIRLFEGRDLNNIITHEIGHMFGLADEYVVEEKGSSSTAGDINCDNHPLTLQNGGYKCKWEDAIPGAGCIPGCEYSMSNFRPAKDFENSMMSNNCVVGPGPLGLGTWNRPCYDHIWNVLHEMYAAPETSG